MCTVFHLSVSQIGTLRLALFTHSLAKLLVRLFPNSSFEIPVSYEGFEKNISQ